MNLKTSITAAKHASGGPTLRVLPTCAVVVFLLAGCLWPPSEDEGPNVVTRVSVGDGGDLVFTPRNVTVHLKEQVQWTIVSGTHTVTFESGLWSGQLEEGKMYTRDFDKPGTYRYRCANHSSGFDDGEGMIGSVSVEDQPGRYA